MYVGDIVVTVFLFKQKTAYEMRISDWSSDVCSSDLERIPAAKALDWGLIHKVVADDALDAEALALAERLAAGPTIALGLIRQQMQQGFEDGYAAAMRREAENQRIARGTKDSNEGGMAFLQKRKPEFRGA